MAEQRYKAVMAVIAEGRTVTQVARDWDVARQTVHVWLERYEADGLEGLANRSHRPAHCPHQIPAAVEAQLLEMRRAKPFWGARRLALELARKGVQAAPSKSAVYRSLVRAGVIDPLQRQRRRESWKRWERAAPMELWQFDVVHGFLLADGTSAKALTGIDDHSRFCVSARLMTRERTQTVCDGFSSALKAYGLPAQVLTDNGKVFTGRFAQPPVKVLFDRICRENGVDHILTEPRSPTTTGKRLICPTPTEFIAAGAPSRRHVVCEPSRCRRELRDRSTEGRQGHSCHVVNRASSSLRIGRLSVSDLRQFQTDGLAVALVAVTPGGHGCVSPLATC